MQRSSVQKNILLFLFFFIAFGWYAITKGQEVSYDFTDYHFYNGFAFFHDRLHLDYAVGEIQTYFNPLLDAFNYVLISHFNDPRLLRFILGGIGGLNGFFLLKICQQLLVKPGRPSTLQVWLALIIGLTGATVLSQIGSVMNDAQAALFVVIALYLMLRGFDAPARKFFWYTLAGIFLGIGMATKLTNAIYFVSVFLAYGISLFFSKKGWNGFVALGLGFILGLLVFQGWWAWRVYQAFGNPVFPYYNNLFHSPYFWAKTSSDGRFGVHTLAEAFKLPFVLMNRNQMIVTESNMRDGRLAALFILMGLWILQRLWAWLRKKKASTLSAPWAFILSFVFISYFIWAFQFGIYRYAIPFALMLGPCIVFLLENLFQNWKIKNLILLLVTVLLLVTTMRPDFGHKQNYDPQFLTVNAPSIPDNAMVIISAPGESFLIPFMNPKARYVNADFPSIADDHIAQTWIEAHQGPLYVLINPSQTFTLARLPQLYALYQVKLQTCQEIQNNMTDFSYQLCSLIKVHGHETK